MLKFTTSKFMIYFVQNNQRLTRHFNWLKMRERKISLSEVSRRSQFKQFKMC